jgi:hypothetical protein
VSLFTDDIINENAVEDRKQIEDSLLCDYARQEMTNYTPPSRERNIDMEFVSAKELLLFVSKRRRLLRWKPRDVCRRRHYAAPTTTTKKVEAMTTTMTKMIMTMSLMTALTALYPRVLQMSHCYGVMTLKMMMKN